MLYIGPWLEYTLAKQLEERESLRPEASRLPRIGGRITAARNSADPSSARKTKTNALPQVAASRFPSTNPVNPVVSAPYAYQRRDFYGEARSMRRFQNELASLRSPSKPIRCTAGTSTSPARGVPASTNKRLVQIQRMQTIYRQGKEKAQIQAQARDKPRKNIILPSIHRAEKASPRQTISRQIRTPTTTDAASVDDSDDDDDLLAWAGGLDLGSI